MGKISLRERLALGLMVLDGAMGTEIQRRGLKEHDFRGDILSDHPQTLAGNNDLLVLTRPDVISDIHESYLEAGADIIETCTFNAQSISQSDYGTAHLVGEINLAAANLATTAAKKYAELTPEKPRYVVGSIGPTTKILSMATADDSDFNFDSLETAYFEQMVPLIKGGVDALLIETIVDTLNAKCAISAAFKAMSKVGRKVEIMLSLTISDASARTLSGQTIEAFITSVNHAKPLSIGMNCSFGAKAMIPYIRRMRQCSPWSVSVHPNAGLPNALGEYDETPQQMLADVGAMVREGLVDIIGGCCGTTPAHISALSTLVTDYSVCDYDSKKARFPFAGLEPIDRAADFVNVGERCNVAGSRKFLRLISEGNYEEALEIARAQVEAGAMMIDINMDDGMLDSVAEMEKFVRLIGTDPEICRVPLMIDSSRFEVIEHAVKLAQGRCVVNSISLKEGEGKFLEKAKKLHDLGASVVVMAFDETGQAVDYDRKVEICSRAYHLLVEQVGFNPEDIIFDPNILTVATGMEEHADYAYDFVRASEWIRNNLPGVHISGGLSNLSFAFRGNNFVREAMHAVFLRRAVAAGLDMAIMNPATSVLYSDVPHDLREAIEDVMFGSRSQEATEHLSTLAAKYNKQKSSLNIPKESNEQIPPSGNVAERLKLALIKGNPINLESDLDEALTEFDSPMKIITGPLMEAMNEVGNRFGRGEMFLPQVVKTARTMKCAVDYLHPHIVASLSQGKNSEKRVYNGKVLIATVKGDVHDIGKNIVAVVLECNNYEVLDLGVMVPPEVIVETALREKPDFVCLSGLITPSLEEMCRVAEAMQRAGLKLPIMIGGATTSPRHTAVKIAPLYDAPVIYVPDASRNPVIAAALINPESATDFKEQLSKEQSQLRERGQSVESAARKEYFSDKYRSASVGKQDSDIEDSVAPNPDAVVTNIPISELRNLIDWRFFYHVWRVPEDTPEGKSLLSDASKLLDRLEASHDYDVKCIMDFFEPAKGKDAKSLLFNRCWVDDASLQEQKVVTLPLPRQIPTEKRPPELCLSLCDFVDDQYKQVGAFAVTMSGRFMQDLEALKGNRNKCGCGFCNGVGASHDKSISKDDYEALLMQSVGDRLAEAAAQWINNKIQDEKGMNTIRPAIGYPSIPDHKSIFILNKLIPLDRIGIKLTENGAMYPQSSVAGFLFSHPRARYFDLLY